jgi:hypothetical protein
MANKSASPFLKADYGICVMPFGRNRGKKFKDIAHVDLASTRKWALKTPATAIKFAELIHDLGQFLTLAGYVDAESSLNGRIEKFVENYPAAISGSGGQRTTFKLALALVWGFELTPDDAMPFLRKYNQRCEPPWTEKELRIKAKSALEDKPKQTDKPRPPRGYLLAE